MWGYPVRLLWHWQQSGFLDFLRQTSLEIWVNMGQNSTKTPEKSGLLMFILRNQKMTETLCVWFPERKNRTIWPRYTPTHLGLSSENRILKHFPVKAATLGSTPENGTPKWTDSVPVPLYLGVKTMISLVNCSPTIPPRRGKNLGMSFLPASN